jgi:hypothetical protein
MKTKLFILVATIGFTTLTGCEPRSLTASSGDDPTPIDFFIKLENIETNEDLFLLDSYSTDSLHLWYFGSDGTKGGPFVLSRTLKDENTILGPMVLVPLTWGLGEPGTIHGGNTAETDMKLFFKNGDIDTLYSVVNCHNSCRYDDKTMQLYYNDELVLDFDFRDKDAELMELLLDNNRYPYKDTVVFTIFKNPEF